MMASNGFVAVLALVATLLSGCISMPEPAYRKVNQDAPEFESAVAQESQRQQAAGKSRRKAEELATKAVTGRFVAREKERRLELVSPLVRALDAFARPSGCWAYTVTTTIRKADSTTVQVERFDPFEPEARVWTLVLRDGRSPDENAQAAYRRDKLRSWKKELKRKSRVTEREMIEWKAKVADFTVDPAEADGQTTFSFMRGHGHVLGLGDIPATRETYTTMDAGAGPAVLRKTTTYLEPASLLGGSATIVTWETATEYLLVGPDLPPFPSKTYLRYRVKALGKDSGEVQVDAVYMDYRRVKCYDDRFGVQVGEPDMLDFVPGNN